MTPYGDDLAYVHDVGFSDFAHKAAPGLLAILRGAGILNGLVVDLGCGTGHLAKHLVDAGYQVYGIDISSSMVAIAQRRVPRARFRVAPMQRARLPKCSAVTAIGECLSYRLAKRAHCQGIRAIFRRVEEVLAPGGVFIFDVLEPGNLGREGRCRTFGEGASWAVLVDAQEDSERQILTRRITTFREMGGGVRRGYERHVLQLIDASVLANELRQLRFGVTIIRGYGALRFRPAHVGFIARKPRVA